MDYKDMKALTLHRPWAHCIIFGPKRIENRTWKPPKSIIGKYIFIHAGKKYDKEAVVFMQENGYNPPNEIDCPTGIIGIVQITGFVEKSQDPWFFGPYGWIIGGVYAFKESIKCSGKQGLWKPDLI